LSSGYFFGFRLFNHSLLLSLLLSFRSLFIRAAAVFDVPGKSKHTDSEILCFENIGL